MYHNIQNGYNQPQTRQCERCGETIHVWYPNETLCGACCAENEAGV
jgi:hypothetical protein